MPQSQQWSRTRREGRRSLRYWLNSIPDENSEELWPMFRQKHCEMMSLVACQLIKISVRSGSKLSLLYSEYCVFTVYLGFVFYFFFHTPSYGYTIERVETRSSVCDSFDYVVSRFTMPGEGYFGICLMSDDIGGLCVLEVLYWSFRCVLVRLT